MNKYIANTLAKLYIKSYTIKVKNEEKQGKITFRDDKERNNYIYKLIKEDLKKKGYKV